MEYFQPYFNVKGFLPSLALTLTWSAFLYRFRTSMWSLAFLALPGTIAHELAHFLMGLVLFAKPQNFTVLPRKTNNSWILGSVSFRGIGLLNGAWVALAPLLLLPLSWFCLIHLVTPLWIKDQIGMWFFSGYLTATFFFAAMPSSQDFKAGKPSILLYLLYGTIGGLGWYAGSNWGA